MSDQEIRNQALRDALKQTVFGMEMLRLDIIESQPARQMLVRIDNMMTVLGGMGKALAMQEPASEPAPASAPSCCGELRAFAQSVIADCERLGKPEWEIAQRARAAIARAQPCQCGELREALEKIAGMEAIDVRMYDQTTFEWAHQRIARLALAASPPRT